MNERRGPKMLWVLIPVLLVVVFLGGRYLWLTMMATEGDVPAASAIPLPADAEILSEERGCASGGCWIEIEVLPAPGSSPQELAEEIGATPQLEIPGNLLDPRTIWVWAEPGSSVLTLRADYFSQEWVP